MFATMITGADIRAYRARLKLTQAQFGEAFGRTSRQVVKYEASDEPLPLNVELAFIGLQTRQLAQ